MKPTLALVWIVPLVPCTPVEGRSQRGDWLLVTHGRTEGWVFGPLLR